MCVKIVVHLTNHSPLSNVKVQNTYCHTSSPSWYFASLQQLVVSLSNHWTFPLILFVLYYYLLPSVVLIFTHPLPLPLSPCPVLHFGSWYILALHVVFLPCISAGLWLSPSHFFALDYQFCNQILHILSSSFLPLCSSEYSPVSRSHTEHLSPSCTNTLLPIPNTCINPTGWHNTTKTFHHPHSSLHKPCNGLQFFFWIPEP